MDNGKVNGEHTKAPNMVMKAMRYTRAITRWIKAGRPCRSRRDINEIYAAHCKHCDEYDEKAETCHLCGCRVNRTPHPLANKIAMGTEHCPAKHW